LWFWFSLISNWHHLCPVNDPVAPVHLGPVFSLSVCWSLSMYGCVHWSPGFFFSLCTVVSGSLLCKWTTLKFPCPRLQQPHWRVMYLVLLKWLKCAKFQHCKLLSATDLIIRRYNLIFDLICKCSWTLSFWHTAGRNNRNGRAHANHGKYNKNLLLHYRVFLHLALSVKIWSIMMCIVRRERDVECVVFARRLTHAVKTLFTDSLEWNKYSRADIGSLSVRQHDEDDSARGVPPHTLLRYDTSSVCRGMCVEVSADIVWNIKLFSTIDLYLAGFLYSSPSTWQELAVWMFNVLSTEYIIVFSAETKQKSILTS